MAKAVVEDFEDAADALRPGRSLQHARLREAAALVEVGRLGLAVKALREFLRGHPRDANALHLLAEVAMRQGRNEDAERLLAQCLEFAPDLAPARFSYANALLQANKPEAALTEFDVLLKKEPRNPALRAQKAIALEAIEDYVAAVALWRGVIADCAVPPHCWVRYGHALRGMGARTECIEAYRKAIELDPSFTRGWWSLADLKTFRFTEAEIGRIEAQLVRTDLAPADRAQLHFALGKAYSDLELHEKSFGNYAKGNALHRLNLKHDPAVLTAYVARCKEFLTADFFRNHSGSGCSSADPIFLVGMTRSGSTLVEQILASHSEVEGTGELSDLAALANRIQTERAPRDDARHPEVLTTLDGARLRGLGEEYLESVRVHRKTSRPFFIDKMGANFAYVGLIRLILPNAKIVDVRRHPLACGLSNFVQLFAKGQNYAYRLADIGCLYRDYVALMAHFDHVLPGHVHRFFYETLVADPEAEIHRLLDSLDLPFEEACLQFHKTDRAVTTVSSEQVRRPIYRDALEQWRPYEPWLGPLIESLGSVLAAYPSVPEDLR